jgi:bis(5'-nucleosyl)-tetraphosphatase (symmetrical)
MATYAIGDIQGCYYAFQALLGRIRFNPKQDTLWLVGDIINRGAFSLEVLRWCYEHQHLIKIVLGNHDLHALVVAEGIRLPHRGDTLQAILDAPDRDVLLTWLRNQPLAISNDEYLMVHAGLLPQWTVNEALAYAKEVEFALQSEFYIDFLRNMYGNTPNYWHPDLTGVDRLRVITNAFTRLRVCTEEGVQDFDFKGELKDIPPGFIPWFDLPARESKGAQIIFGHWSALGLHERDHVYAIDTGCLWGGKLTAMCLENKAIFQVASDIKDQPLKI